MAKRIGRRAFLGGLAAATLPMPAIAQSEPVRMGLLTVKTGPMTQGGRQMEQAVLVFLKQRNNLLAGRKVELIVADTGGNPAGAKTKARELVERDKVDVVLGPFAAFELAAISEYMASQQMPLLSLAAADDITQRKPNPYYFRAGASSSQPMHPLAAYAAKELKYKTAVCISDDFAYGHEQIGGFQRVFQDNGGRVTNKFWPPLVTPDYAPYIVQLGSADCVVTGFGGSNPVKFIKQCADMGLKMPILGGDSVGDESLLRSYGDEVIGLITAEPYSMDVDTPSNHLFIEAMLRDYDIQPGFYASGLYVNCQVVEAGLIAMSGRTDDRTALASAMRAVSLTDTPGGPVRFDDKGNAICSIYIRRTEKKNDKLVNTIIKTYHDVSQFWTYDEKWFLDQPVYSRDYPPLRT